MDGANDLARQDAVRRGEDLKRRKGDRDPEQDSSGPSATEADGDGVLMTGDVGGDAGCLHVGGHCRAPPSWWRNPGRFADTA